jgi:hypothetical protein
MVDLPGWFYDVFFPALGILVGWLFGWKLTRNESLKAIFKRRK